MVSEDQIIVVNPPLKLLKDAGCRARIRTWAGGSKVPCATTTQRGNPISIIVSGPERVKETGTKNEFSMAGLPVQKVLFAFGWYHLSLREVPTYHIDCFGSPVDGESRNDS